MAKAMRLPLGLVASLSPPEGSVLLLEACALACLLDRAKLPLLLQPEPLDPRQPLLAGFPLHEWQRQLAEEHSWDSPS
jgi:hypothetical protein